MCHEASANWLTLCFLAEPSEAGMGQGAPDRGRLGHSEPAQLWGIWRHDTPPGTPAPGCPGGFRGTVLTDTEHSIKVILREKNIMVSSTVQLRTSMMEISTGSDAVTIPDAGAVYAEGQRPKGSLQLEKQHPSCRLTAIACRQLHCASKTWRQAMPKIAASTAHGCLLTTLLYSAKSRLKVAMHQAICRQFVPCAGRCTEQGGLGTCKSLYARPGRPPGCCSAP